MPVRLFAGYFLVLAACATIAFSASDAEPSPAPASAAGFMPPDFYSYHTGSFSIHRHRIVLKRTEIAESQ